jgi:hypothetical protein
MGDSFMFGSDQLGVPKLSEISKEDAHVRPIPGRHMGEFKTLRFQVAALTASVRWPVRAD